VKIVLAHIVNQLFVRACNDCTVRDERFKDALD
jgi:hypothetical protein